MPNLSESTAYEVMRLYRDLGHDDPLVRAVSNSQLDDFFRNDANLLANRCLTRASQLTEQAKVLQHAAQVLSQHPQSAAVAIALKLLDPPAR